jgi:hypothetical protein
MKRILGMLLFLPMILAGCASMSDKTIKEAVKKPAPRVEEPTYIFHRVVSGETMGTIARYYSGKEGMWPAIAEANPELNPVGLKQDDIVKVPVAIATVNKEQPAYSTARRSTKKSSSKKGTAAAAKQPRAEDSADDEDDDEPVFGPR